MSQRPSLRALADRLGILPSYRDVEGREQATSDATAERLARAMGHEASDEAAAARVLADLDRQAAQRLLEPVLVWREWHEASPQTFVNAAALEGARDYAIEVQLEDGRRERREGRLEAAPDAGTLTLPLPLRPPHGYHEVRLELDGPGGTRQVAQRLVMAPRQALQPEARVGGRRAYGVLANLYSLRSHGDWGHGSLRGLADLGRLAGAHGAAFVGINPLHANSSRGLDFAPYSPTSRLFRNVLYLDPESVPELVVSPGARALLAEPSLRERRAALSAAERLDHEAVLEALLPVLRELHASFSRRASAERRAAYAAYREREGQALLDFATWEVLAEELAPAGAPPDTAWWRWPERFRDPRSPGVAEFRRSHAAAIDFRCWLQFELDQQLAGAADALQGAGCPLGIYVDLALGSSRASADTWMDPSLFATDATVGAPPDAYAPDGQDWGFPPFRPGTLRDAAYRPWSRLLRSALAHAGALRLDHAMSLLRLYWIPAGCSGAEGAYVRYRAEELLGVLALESHRHAAVVVAEDLGTVPPELPGMLDDWGVLHSAVLYFERDGQHFRPSARYPARALATVGTHDLAPLAGFLDGSDLTLRERVGGLPGDGALAEARQEREQAVGELVQVLRQESHLGGDEPDPAGLRRAVHDFLADTPSVLVGIALDDLAGEREPVNLPGVPLERHRSWSRRMGRSLEELAQAPEVKAALEPLGARRSPPGQR